MNQRSAAQREGLLSFVEALRSMDIEPEEIEINVTMQAGQKLLDVFLQDYPTIGFHQKDFTLFGLRFVCNRGSK